MKENEQKIALLSVGIIRSKSKIRGKSYPVAASVRRLPPAIDKGNRF